MGCISEPILRRKKDESGISHSGNIQLSRQISLHELNQKGTGDSCVGLGTTLPSCVTSLAVCGWATGYNLGSGKGLWNAKAGGGCAGNSKGMDDIDIGVGARKGTAIALMSTDEVGRELRYTSEMEITSSSLPHSACSW